MRADPDPLQEALNQVARLREQLKKEQRRRIEAEAALAAERGQGARYVRPHARVERVARRQAAEAVDRVHRRAARNLPRDR